MSPKTAPRPPASADPDDWRQAKLLEGVQEGLKRRQAAGLATPRAPLRYAPVSPQTDNPDEYVEGVALATLDRLVKERQAQPPRPPRP